MIEHLCIQISGDFCEIDQLAASLLRFCRDHADQLRLAYDSDRLCALLGNETDALQRWFEAEIEEDWLEQRELAAVAELLRGVARRAGDVHASPEQAAVLAARAAADALDRSHGRRFAGVFRGRGVTEIAPGDPIPVCRPPLKELFRSELSTNPARLGEHLLELQWLRLLPRLERAHQVRLSFESEDVLADLSPRTLVAVAIPCDGLSELRFDRTTGTAQPRFYHVRPARSEEQRERILRLLDQADQAGTRILVLPELCVDQDIAAAIDAWFDHPDRSLSILVCGSMHVERDGHKRNVSVILMPGGRRIEHFKFNPFYVPLPTDGGGLAEHREDIVTHPSTVTVAMCGDWSFTVLICKDFLEPSVDRLLELLGVRLVLVPACSPKTDIFEPIAGILAARNQAVVLIGNLTDPGSDDPASAIVTRPTKKNRIQRITREEINPPCLLFFQLARSQRTDS